MERRDLIKVDTTLFELQKLFLVTYGNYCLTGEGSEKLQKIRASIGAMDNPIDLRRDVKSSFLHSYMQNFQDVCADLQRHYPVKIKEVSIAEFYTYLKSIKKLYEQNKSK